MDEITSRSQIPQERQIRYSSHALVEVRRFNILPIFCYSGVLIDISVGGFKLEFTAEITVSPGQRYWLHIPLSPLGIVGPKKLICHCECRWFDSNRYRIGGVFLNLSQTQRLIIEQIVSSLKARGHF